MELGVELKPWASGNHFFNSLEGRGKQEQPSVVILAATSDRKTAVKPSTELVTGTGVVGAVLD